MQGRGGGGVGSLVQERAGKEQWVRGTGREQGDQGGSRGGPGGVKRNGFREYLGCNGGTVDKYNVQVGSIASKQGWGWRGLKQSASGRGKLNGKTSGPG